SRLEVTRRARANAAPPRQPSPTGTVASGAVALLELLARAAPAGVIAADLLPVGDDPLDGQRLTAGHGRAVTVSQQLPGGGRRGADRLRARGRVVLVAQVAVHGLRLLRGLQLLGALDRHLHVEELQDDLLADRGGRLLEHRVRLGRVLVERVLLG